MIRRILLSLIFVFSISSSNILVAKVYKGAEYRTKESYLYGRFEVSYIPAKREGVISSFFTYNTENPEWNEIDIEFVGRYENIIQFNTISNGQVFHIRSNFLDFDPFVDFHTYAFEWTPEYVAWFVDGEEVYRQTGEHIPTLEFPQKLMMNIWNPIYTNWVGNWNDNALPAFAYYDWISYSSYAPGEGDYGTGNNFKLEWRDELDSWNQERWEKATHTFGGNQADFIPGNVVFNEGNMILCLTDNVDTGYVDMRKPQVKWVRENFENSLTVQYSEEVDIISAETASNYLMAGVNVTDAILDEDRMKLKLFTNNYDKAKNYSLIVLNVTDDSPSPNVIDLRGTTVIKSEELNYPIKINVGGESYQDFLPDQEWSENVLYGYWAGDVHYWSQVEDILHTEDDEIYRSERVGITTYKVRVPNDSYSLSLMFAKNDNAIIGDRVFDIVVENELIQSDIDIIALAGANTAYQINTDILVQDEIIDIYFQEEVDSAFINGIVVNRLTTSLEQEKNSGLVDDYKLFQNYPNPFNPATKFSFSLKQKSEVTLTLYDALGRQIETIIEEIYPAGYHEINFDASQISAGIYFYRLNVGGNKSHAKKMVYLK
jgi:hypothetical protein